MGLDFKNYFLVEEYGFRPDLLGKINSQRKLIYIIDIFKAIVNTKS